jgi:hypothetical protein
MPESLIAPAAAAVASAVVLGVVVGARSRRH